DGVHAFLDDLAPSRPDRRLLEACRSRHLVHVSLGVESGDPSIREAYGKTWRDDELRAIVSDLKACGVRTSILTLVGAGGEERAGEHLTLTAELLSSLDLIRGDAVFLLDERELLGPDLPPGGGHTLTRATRTRQQEQLKRALSPLR